MQLGQAKPEKCLWQQALLTRLNGKLLFCIYFYRKVANLGQHYSKQSAVFGEKKTILLRNQGLEPGI